MSKRILFILAAVVLAGAGIYYRAASTHTARLQADAIVAADAAGADINKDLAILRDFVSSHLGASVSFTLQASYDRMLAKSQPAAPAPVSSNSQIYTEAQRACAGKSDSITQARCNEAYLQAHLNSSTPTPTPVPGPVPKLADYQYNLKAPLWTPDLAGALLLGAAAAALAAFLARQRKR
jgi:hypothetical protein